MILEIKNIITSVGLQGNKRFILNLNKYRNAHYQVLAKAKREFNMWVALELMKVGKGIRFNAPVGFHYKIWVKKRTDFMNIGVVVDKFLQDAIVKVGILPDDNPDYVQKTSFNFMGYEKKNRVDVVIKPVKESPIKNKIVKSNFCVCGQIKHVGFDECADCIDVRQWGEKLNK